MPSALRRHVWPHWFLHVHAKPGAWHTARFMGPRLPILLRLILRASRSRSRHKTRKKKETNRDSRVKNPLSSLAAPFKPPALNPAARAYRPVTPENFLPTELRELAARVKSTESALLVARKRSAFLSRKQRMRSFYRVLGGEQEVAIALILSLVGAGVGSIFAAVVSDGVVGTTIICGLVSLGLLFLPQYWLVGFPPSEQLPKLLDLALRTATNAAKHLTELKAQFEQAYAVNLEVRREREKREREEAARRRKESLECSNWKDLGGIEFEQFLVRVFHELGFETETTKTTGDQGVDLVVHSGPIRIAVQAKGYSGSVGNDAVQQVVAGMVIYRCQQCMVVTNSKFTSGAIALANANNCLLIDSDNVPRLIWGQIVTPRSQP